MPSERINMKNIKMVNRIMYLLFLFGFLFYLFSGFIFSKVDIKTPADDKIKMVIEPDKKEYIGGGTVEYSLKLSTASSDNMAIYFISRHQEIEVYANDNLIYYVKAHKSIYGTTTGTNYSIVNIPSYTTDVKVKLTNVYEGVKQKETTFEYGDEARILKELISEAFLPAVLSALIILVGIAMIMLWIICNKRISQIQALFYFGIFAMLIGAWSLNETSIAMLFIEDRKLASLMGYVLIMMLPIPFVQAEKNFFHIHTATVSNALCTIFSLMDIVLIILHITGMAEFKRTVLFIHIMLIIALLYFCGVVVDRIIKNGFDRKVKSNIIAVVALSSSMLVDLYAYYRHVQEIDVIGKFGILIFIVLLGYEIVSEVLEMIRDGQKAAFYKEMAEKDVMTGLYNRSAFEHWEQNMEDYNGYAIVTFDLNNLKYCNDNIGHAAGDAYIEASAKLIREIFGKYGKCYRIGGDEFCAIIRKNKRFNIEKYKKRLRWREKQITEKLGIVGLNVHIACGYAEYDNEKDEDFESTRSRADKKMYESKKILKKDK